MNDSRDCEIVDTVFILPRDNRYTTNSLTASASGLISLLKSQGFHVNLFSSTIKSKSIIAIVFAPKSLLREHAPHCEYLKLQMSPNGLASIYDVDDRMVQNNKAMEYVYLRYNENLEKKKLYIAQTYAGGNGVFQESVRHTIIDDILRKEQLVDIDSPQEFDEIILDSFAPHQEKQTAYIWGMVSKLLLPFWYFNFNQVSINNTKPIQAIKSYLGLTSAYQYMFMIFMIKCLIFPALLVTLVWLLIGSSIDSNSNSASNIAETSYCVAFGFVVPLLLLVMMHYWEIFALVCASEWGTYTLPTPKSKKHAAQWQKVGNPVFNSVARDASYLWPLHHDYRQVQNWLQNIRFIKSIVLGLCLLGIGMLTLMIGPIIGTRAIAVVIGLNNPLFGLYIPNLIHGLTIIFLGGFINNTCRCLTNLENHRTKIDFYRSVLYKSIVTKICLWVSPSVYYGFFQESIEGTCHWRLTCMQTSGDSAFIAFLMIWISDLFKLYAIPILCKQRKDEFIAINSTSLQNLATSGLNLNHSGYDSESDTGSDRDRNRGQQENDEVAQQMQDQYQDQYQQSKSKSKSGDSIGTIVTTSHNYSINQATATSIRVEKEWVSLLKSARTDRDYDDRSSLSSHYDTNVSLVIKVFIMAMFSGVAPLIVVFQCLFLMLEIPLSINLQLFYKRRSFLTSNPLCGIDENIINAMKCAVMFACAFLPLYYIRLNDISSSGDFSEVGIFKLYLAIIYMWFCSMFQQLLVWLNPLIPDSVHLIHARQEFFEKDLISSSSSNGSGSGSKSEPNTIGSRGARSRLSEIEIDNDNDNEYEYEFEDDVEGHDRGGTPSSTLLRFSHSHSHNRNRSNDCNITSSASVVTSDIESQSYSDSTITSAPSWLTDK